MKGLERRPHLLECVSCVCRANRVEWRTDPGRAGGAEVARLPFELDHHILIYQERSEED